MEKPMGYDEVQVAVEFTPLALGGHKLIIRSVEETKSKAGRDMLKVEFDTAPDDTQPRYYGDLYDGDTRETRKWGGVSYILPTDAQGRTSRTFKTFCSSVERSNAGFSMQWGAQFAQCLKGKRVGGVFGEEEYLNQQNEVKKSRKLRWWCSTDAAADSRVPELRKLDGGASPASTDPNGFMEIPAGLNAELPF